MAIKQPFKWASEKHYIFDKNIDYNYLLFFTINLNQCHFIVSFPYSKRKQYLLQRAIIRSFTLMI